MLTSLAAGKKHIEDYGWMVVGPQREKRVSRSWSVLVGINGQHNVSCSCLIALVAYLYPVEKCHGLTIKSADQLKSKRSKLTLEIVDI